ncbi:hypothetical protein D3C81_480130 [compost metagenome]
MEAAKCSNRCIDGGLGRRFLTDVGDGITRLAAQCLRFGLHRFGVEVDEHDLGTGFNEHFGSRRAQPRGCTADDEILVGNLHDVLPQALAVKASAACCLAISWLRRMKRCSLPLGVLGSSLTNSISRG